MCKFFRNPLCKNGSRFRTNILRLSSEIYPSPQNIIFRQPYVGKVSFTNDSVNGIVRDGHSAVRNDEESVVLCPAHFGQALWSDTLVSQFGKANWSVTSVRPFG